MSEFAFLDPGPLVDADLSLELVQTNPGNAAVFYVPAYRFVMHLAGADRTAGAIQLRAVTTDRIALYRGHIGYEVYPPFRGRHLAARASRLLFPLARAHGIDPLWITCDPANTASRRTCELIGGRLVEIVPLPEDEDMYLAGERYKCRYRVDLG